MRSFWNDVFCQCNIFVSFRSQCDLWWDIWVSTWEFRSREMSKLLQCISRSVLFQDIMSRDPSVIEQRQPAESFVVFGTAFPEQTERDRRAGVSDSGQFVPVWKQEVRDEKGRRRFHGAFTGGFSAGYFNTVGSKEGMCTVKNIYEGRAALIDRSLL